MPAFPTASTTGWPAPQQERAIAAAATAFAQDVRLFVRMPISGKEHPTLRSAVVAFVGARFGGVFFCVRERGPGMLRAGLSLRIWRERIVEVEDRLKVIAKPVFVTVMAYPFLLSINFGRRQVPHPLSPIRACEIEAAHKTLRPCEELILYGRNRANCIGELSAGHCPVAGRGGFTCGVCWAREENHEDEA